MLLLLLHTGGSEIRKLREFTGTGVVVDSSPLQLLDMWKFNKMLDGYEVAAASKYIGVEVEDTPVAVSMFSIDDIEDASDTSGMADQVSSAGSVSDGLGPPPGVLVRRIVGVDAETDAIAVSGPIVRLGAFVRFQVRDSQSCGSELASLRKLVPAGAVGGMLFTDSSRAEMTSGADVADRDAFSSGKMQTARLLGSSQVGPLPAPGYQQYFPIRSPGFASSTFQHASSAVYLLVFNDVTPE
jgi:hypothetical protein